MADREYCLFCGLKVTEDGPECSCATDVSLTEIGFRVASRVYHQKFNTDAMIYLAVPYLESGALTEKSLIRVEAVNHHAGELIKKGFKIFSPISHGHAIAISSCLPKDNEYWWAYNRNMINCCQMVMVLTMDGWEESIGVGQEIDYAISIGTPVVLLDPKTGVSTPYRMPLE
jgi:hypothetical protein